MRNALWILIVATLLGGATVVRAKDNPASAELLADVASIQPGATFHLAVRVTMQQGWHVYWMNPGDAGMPTTVTFHAPDGFTVETLADPVPKRFTQPGGVVGYGYDEPVMLVATVTAPANLKSTEPIEFSADAKWLVCKDVCIPGKASPNLSLPIGTASTANEEAFKEAIAEIPVPVDATNIKIKHAGAEHTITLNGKYAQHMLVSPFVAPSDGWLIENVSAVPGSAIIITVRYDVRQLDPDIKSGALTIVLAYDDGSGHRRGFLLTDTLSAE